MTLIDELTDHTDASLLEGIDCGIAHYELTILPDGTLAEVHLHFDTTDDRDRWCEVNDFEPIGIRTDNKPNGIEGFASCELRCILSCR
ncbi:hypothetical protein [Lyngbya sp. CCY1209]|uniref:hypothetical protein n=1 Tax=Lyngbya sp. CCY1209 TaxID=2886103 RepID=UPI002D20D900|nr:hypothetical protein [Lyngbya sp. CCY1209]MEB3884041.1 hypothetical protein [Lyngbya sp. CCY1209]